MWHNGLRRIQHCHTCGTGHNFWLGFDPWPRNFQNATGAAKKKKKEHKVKYVAHFSNSAAFNFFLF